MDLKEISYNASNSVDSAQDRDNSYFEHCETGIKSPGSISNQGSLWSGGLCLQDRGGKGMQL